jgi:DNA ligase-associated metallophosphoesterase
MVELAGEQVELLAERALWWPSARVLVVADLHWGKVETFHAHGIPVPAGVLGDDLDRLGRAIARTGASRVLVLGDLVHGPLRPAVVEAVSTWRHTHRTPMALIRGNHDRHAPTMPEAWNIEDIRGELREGPFLFTHVPAEHPGAYTLAGHLHPTLRLRGRGDSLRLPCFFLGPRVGVLPAFSAFSGGVAVRPARGDRVWVVAEGAVVPVGGSRSDA